MSTSAIILEFAREHFGADAGQVQTEPLRGGLETASLWRVQIRSALGRQAGSFVVKRLSGSGLREYAVHVRVGRLPFVAVPRILGTRCDEDGRLHVLLEWIGAQDPWPWRNSSCVSMVLNSLAQLHRSDGSAFDAALAGWNYDQELTASADATVAAYRLLSQNGFRVTERPMRRTLERVGLTVAEMRKQAMAFTGTAMLHGDVHPGNVVVRAARNGSEAVLLDWGRARLGTPLEDVMSWLHSLGFWEPSARKIHDSLLVSYLRATGRPDVLTPGFRDACWLAAGANAMAGALRYHLVVAADAGQSDEARWNSARAAADWLRIVRRADMVWRR